jgi:hypothetical protein
VEVVCIPHRRIRSFRRLLVLQLFLDDQLDPKPELRRAALQFQQPEYRLHEFCHLSRCADRPCDRGSFERLGQRESDEEERRYSRAGNEIACYE